MKDNEANNEVRVVSLEMREVNIPQPKETPDKSKGFVTFGEGNAYPDFLFNCYSDCSHLQSIILGLIDYVCAAGMDNQDLEKRVINKKGETLIELVKQVVADYLIFGAFAIQIIRDKGGRITELLWIDCRRVRLDEEGEVVYYRKDWTKYGREMKKYDRWQRDKKFDNCIFYYKRPAARGVYGLPMWSSVVKDVTTAIEISKFHLSAILNNFVASAVINFNNGVPTKDEQKMIERKINDKFSGSTNAARMLVSFNNNKDQAVTIARVPEDNFDQKYQALSKSTKENIFVAFRAQPQLFGTDPDRTGFNSQEYQESFKLFKKTVVAPIQSEIETAFARIDPAFTFRLNEFTIDFEPNQTPTVV